MSQMPTMPPKTKHRVRYRVQIDREARPVGKPDALIGHLQFDERVVSRTRREARCCTKDEGRPFGAALWEEASNCRKLLRPKATVVNVPVKRRDWNHVMYGLERRMQMNL